MALIKCPECGKDFSEMAEACPNCGYSIKKAKEQTMLKPVMERKSKYKAGLLAIFFFVFGAHEFYLGRIGNGIAWIAFFLLFGWWQPYFLAIMAGIAFIEGLFLMFMNQEKFDYTFNRIKKQKTSK